MIQRVIVTRPRQDAHKWVKALAQAGFDAITLPLIEVAPAVDVAAVVSAWQRLPSFDAVMFVSGNAVDHFFALKPALTPVFSAQAAIKTRALVTGPGSHSALVRAQVAPEWIDAPNLQAGQFDSEALWAVVRHSVHPGYRVLIVRGVSSEAGASDDGHGREWFAKQVVAAGGVVEFVVSYQRRGPDWDSPTLALFDQAAQDGSVWLFSSSEAISNLVRTRPGLSWARARAIATHPRIAQAAREAGFALVCESRPQLEHLIVSIESMQ